MDVEPKSKLKSFAERAGLVGGVLGVIASIIAIYQFISGNTSISAFIDHISLPPIQIEMAQPFRPILYHSFWTWFWWYIAGVPVAGLIGMVFENLHGDDKYRSAFFAFGLGYGFLGVLFGYLSSLLISHLQMPYGFLISIGAECVLVFLGLVILIGIEATLRSL